MTKDDKQPAPVFAITRNNGNEPRHSAILNSDLVTRNESATVGNLADRRHSINRRGNVWLSLLYGNFRPRRRSSRRAADSHHFLFDWHEPRVLFLALAIILLSCIDALFTLNLLNAGATEANLFMAKMLEHSVDKFLAVKIMVTGFSVVIMVVAARRKFVGFISVEHVLQICCFAYLLVICYELYLYKFVFDLKILPIG